MDRHALVPAMLAHFQAGPMLLPALPFPILLNVLSLVQRKNCQTPIAVTPERPQKTVADVTCHVPVLSKKKRNATHYTNLF